MKTLFSILVLLAAVILTLGRSDERHTDILTLHPEIDPTSLVIIEDRLYFVESVVKVSAQEATQVCNELNMRLVTLETEQKNMAIRNYLINQTLDMNAYWTGGQKYLGGWQWNGIGEFFVYTNWFIDQPDYVGTLSTVLVLFGAYGWFDYPYNLQHNFICE